MKHVICLYGGPGSGKSTTAAHLFALLKQEGKNAELVTEYVKNWVWEDRKILKGDQYYLFAKQSRSERLKYKEVDFIVTDAPVDLSVIYERKFEPKPHICELLVKKHLDIAKDMGVKHHNIFLKRIKKYNQKGRYQSEDEAKIIDQEIKEYLLEFYGGFIEIIGDNNAAENIIKNLNL